MSEGRANIGVIEIVKRKFKALGYTQPGQSLNVATAQGIAAEAAVLAQAEAREEVAASCCPRCKDRIERRDGGVF